jgi:hypothetical protein
MIPRSLLAAIGLLILVLVSLRAGYPVIWLVLSGLALLVAAWLSLERGNKFASLLYAFAGVVTLALVRHGSITKRIEN